MLAMQATAARGARSRLSRPRSRSERTALERRAKAGRRSSRKSATLRASHERLRLELELLRRRIFVAKAERVDTAQLELEFAAKLAELDRLGADFRLAMPDGRTRRGTRAGRRPQEEADRPTRPAQRFRSKRSASRSPTRSSRSSCGGQGRAHRLRGELQARLASAAACAAS